MKLEVDIKKKDLFAFYKFAYWQSPEKRSFRLRSRVQNGLVLAILPFAIFLTGISFSTSLGLDLLFISSILGVLGYKLADKLAESRIEKVAMEILTSGKTQDLIGPMSVELGDGVFIWRTTNSETKIVKNGLGKLAQNNRYYFVFNSVVTGYVIPKRFFKNDEEKSEFESWWENGGKFLRT